MGVWLQQRLPSQPEARGLLGIAEGEKIVVFIGNLSYRKGVDVLLKAVAKVARCDVSFRVIIGGQGPERANSFQLISQLGLGGIVRFVGPVAPDDVFTWFAAADICAVPSRTETFGLVALEAMACGTPVVAANVGGLSETITHGENGLLFPLEDDAALAAHICELFSNESLRSKLAERGRETAREHDMRLQAEKVGQIYRDLIEHRSGD